MMLGICSFKEKVNQAVLLTAHHRTLCTGLSFRRKTDLYRTITTMLGAAVSGYTVPLVARFAMSRTLCVTNADHLLRRRGTGPLGRRLFSSTAVHKYQPLFPHRLGSFPVQFTVEDNMASALVSNPPPRADGGCHRCAECQPFRVDDPFTGLVHAIRQYLGQSSGIDSADVDPAHIMTLMSRYTSNPKEWEKYARADTSRNYTRNLVDNINGKANLVSQVQLLRTGTC